jgi:hypothetical protein
MIDSHGIVTSLARRCAGTPECLTDSDQTVIDGIFDLCY